MALASELTLACWTQSRHGWYLGFYLAPSSNTWVIFHIRTSFSVLPSVSLVSTEEQPPLPVLFPTHPPAHSQYTRTRSVFPGIGAKVDSPGDHRHQLLLFTETLPPDQPPPPPAPCCLLSRPDCQMSPVLARYRSFCQVQIASPAGIPEYSQWCSRVMCSLSLILPLSLYLSLSLSLSVSLSVSLSLSLFQFH